ncbi:MAG: LacI family DNA-binding transcriptional regulator [Clostridiales bacterium]|nr:LacI family DNA-binding transcriptional regulator [Clostridiales bacterium]
MKVSIKEISQRTGFSPATVSNALNYKKGVNAGTAAKILEAAREMGYLSEDRITKLKFVIFTKTGDITETSPFFAQMMTGIERECRNCGLDMILCNLDSREDDYQEQAKRLMNDKTSAVILLGTEMSEEDEWIIRGMTCPFLVVDYWREDMSFDGIMINNADSAQIAVEYLLRKGHREIGYLRGTCRLTPFCSREAGYENALRKAGIPIKKEYTVTLSPRMDESCAAMAAYLKKKPPLPTAFLSDNDLIALGAMKAMREYGIRIPEDVSVIGFDDLSYSAISVPPLTTLRVPKQEMGREAVRRLQNMIQDGDRTRWKMQVCTQIIERGSVCDRNG